MNTDRSFLKRELEETTGTSVDHIPRMIRFHYWFIIAVSIYVTVTNPLIANTIISVYKPSPLRPIISAPQIIQSCLLIPYIPTIPERVQIRQLIICSCQGARITQGFAPRVIFVLNDLLSRRVRDRYDITLQVVDVPI